MTTERKAPLSILARADHLRARLLARGSRIRAALPFTDTGRMRKLIHSIHPHTLGMHEQVVEWARDRAAMADGFGSADDLVGADPRMTRWAQRIGRLATQFQDRYAADACPRFLLQIPFEEAVAWASLIANLADGLEFIGAPVRLLTWNDRIEVVLDDFRPTVLLVIGHEPYIPHIDWDAVRRYRKRSELLIGVAAGPEDWPGARAEVERLLDWADRERIGFFYRWDPIHGDRRYRRHIESGFELLTIEYGANPLIYRPVAGMARDLDYVFLGSAHSDKWHRYVRYFSPILTEHPGFLLGPAWPTGPTKVIPREAHRYLYARAKVALNLHIGKQISRSLQLNERVYNVAACGAPQLVDDPMLLLRRFSRDAFFVASTPDEYRRTFEMLLEEPDESARRADLGQEEVLSRYTVFHVADALVQDIRRLTARGVG